jgi:hypothetical protein
MTSNDFGRCPSFFYKASFYKAAPVSVFNTDFPFSILQILTWHFGFRSNFSQGALCGKSSMNSVYGSAGNNADVSNQIKDAALGDET